METKPLLYGLIGFFIGGLLVSVAAKTFAKPDSENVSGMSMSQMTESISTKKGNAYDEAFIAAMIEHHEGAIEMAKLSTDRAQHAEIQRLSQDIIAAQEREIIQMKQWQADWGYTTSEGSHMAH